MEVLERDEEEDEDWTLFIFFQKMIEFQRSFWSRVYVDIPASI